MDQEVRILQSEPGSSHGRDNQTPRITVLKYEDSEGGDDQILAMRKAILAYTL